MSCETLFLDENERHQVIERLIDKLNKHYLFADVAQELALALQQNLAQGVYSSLTSGPAFATVLTDHLRTLSRDRHMYVHFSEEPQPEPEPQVERTSPAEEKEQWHLAEAVRNFGFEQVARLPGNIGYLDLRGFAEASWAAETAHAVMSILNNTYALILDLRQNRGGWPSMVLVLTSYFFAEEVYLGAFRSREDNEVRQVRTFPYLCGPKYLDKPVYLLTSSQTFSAAEGFAGHLRAQNRATIIGETTGGGIYIGRPFYLTPHFQAWISTGGTREQPLTSEGEPGIIPDIPVPEQQAFTRAHIEALKHVLARLGAHPSGALIALKDEAQATLDTLTSTR